MVSRFNAYAVGLQNNFLRIDEVRYKENLPPIGFNYIKLGLQDVLLDPETGDIYTPNTNQMVNVGSVKGLTPGGGGDIMEERKKTNWVKGSRGRFAGSAPVGVRLSKGEYRKIVSEINTNYGKYAGKKYCVHFSLWKDKYYRYNFINYGFDDYRFIGKERE